MQVARLLMDGDEIELTRDDLLLSRIGRRQERGSLRDRDPEDPRRGRPRASRDIDRSQVVEDLGEGGNVDLEAACGAGCPSPDDVGYAQESRRRG